MINTLVTDALPQDQICNSKQLRVDIDVVIQDQKRLLTGSRERSLTLTKLQEAVMWLGMDLKRISEANPESASNPYPNSYKPENAIVEPTADGLKL